jgi:hypothetical protein
MACSRWNQRAINADGGGKASRFATTGIEYRVAAVWGIDCGARNSDGTLESNSPVDGGSRYRNKARVFGRFMGARGVIISPVVAVTA